MQCMIYDKVAFYIHDYISWPVLCLCVFDVPQIAKFMGPTWSRRPQIGPMLAPWTSGTFSCADSICIGLHRNSTPSRATASLYVLGLYIVHSSFNSCNNHSTMMEKRWCEICIIDISVSVEWQLCRPSENILRQQTISYLAVVTYWSFIDPLVNCFMTIMTLHIQLPFLFNWFHINMFMWNCICLTASITWRSHEMEHFLHYWPPCDGYPSFTSKLSHKRSVLRGTGAFFVVKLENLLTKQSTCRWFETPWGLCDDTNGIK